MLSLLPVAPAQAALAPPKGLSATSTAATKIALGWDEVKSAPKYRIQYSTSSKLSKATYIREVDNARDITGLKPSTRYYFRVRVITTSGKGLSDYSSTFSVETRASSSYSYLAPPNLRVTSSTGSAISVDWDGRGSGIRYRIEYSTSASKANPVYRRFTPSEATITGLKPGKPYYFRVRVITNGGGNLSSYSPLIKGQTRTATGSSGSGTTGTGSGAPLRVASYNVKCANCFANLPNEGTWYERRGAVVANLADQDLDVLGIQEASQGWLKDKDGNTIDLSQFEDLQQRLGSKYRLANTKRNNCVKSTTPTRCVYADQGASKGTKIIYNSSRVTLLDQGSRRLSEVSSSDHERFVAWAILQQRSTGKKFFFANTHLEAKSDGAGQSAYHEMRRLQAREVLAVIAAKNRQKLPVVVTGDFNSTKFRTPTNAPYNEILSGGLVDPLGNSYRSTTTSTGATVEKRIRTEFFSYNGYDRTAAQRSHWVNGSNIDYLFTSPMRVSEYETVVDVDSAGRFNGIIPSDHNLLRATVHLP